MKQNNQNYNRIVFSSTAQKVVLFFFVQLINLFASTN